MNDLKMNIAGTMKIGHDSAKSYATISNTGEIEITGTEDEIRQCIENTPQHLKFAGYLVLEIMLLRRALDFANVKEHATPLAGAGVGTGVEVHTTGDVADREASGGCVSRLVRLTVVRVRC
jgi:hypothetical protein